MNIFRSKYSTNKILRYKYQSGFIKEIEAAKRMMEKLNEMSKKANEKMSQGNFVIVSQQVADAINDVLNQNE